MSNQHIDDVYNGLPKQFIASLKILFDILDEEHTGSIRLRDIESRWSDEGVRDLPTGVMEGLRKVTPSSGLLTFDGFVAGLKMALIQGKEQGKRRSVSGNSNYIVQKENRIPSSGNFPFSTWPADRPPTTTSRSTTYLLHGETGSRQQDSQSASDAERQGPASVQRSTTYQPSAVKKHIDIVSNSTRPATAAVKPQPHGMSSTSNRRSNPTSHNTYELPAGQGYPTNLRPPTRPERTFNPAIRKSASGSDLNPPKVPPRDSSKNRQILSELKTWQQHWDAHERGGRAGSGAGGRPQGKEDATGSSVQDSSAHAIYANIEQFQRKPSDDRAQIQSQSPGKASVRRHGSGRRHTLQNGVDHNMIKRMQQLEEEVAVLKNGLEMVETARDWYLRQMAAVQEKQKMLGKVNYNDNSVEAHQERLNFQKVRIAEVNLQLRTLVDSSEKGFPLHMNLAVSSGLTPHSSDAAVRLLKEQNRRLTQEVSEKSEKIAKLDQEKASLIRELFEARTKHKSSYDDTTFM